MKDNSMLGGEIFFLLLLICPAIHFLTKSYGPRLRSLRVANLALACGFTAIVMPETVFGLSPAAHPAIFLLSGILHATFGLLGIILAVRAFKLRRDGGTGVARTATAAGLSVLTALVGAEMFFFRGLAQPGTPWVYQSADGTFQLTLPSNHWTQAASGGQGLITFTRPQPEMTASVLFVKQNQTRADFDRLAKEYHTLATQSSLAWQQVQQRDGTTASGDQYEYCTGTDTAADGHTLFVAYSFIWSEKNQTVIQVIFEGVSNKLSNAGKEAETAAFESSAEIICLSAVSLPGKMKAHSTTMPETLTTDATGRQPRVARFGRFLPSRGGVS